MTEFLMVARVPKDQSEIWKGAEAILGEQERNTTAKYDNSTSPGYCTHLQPLEDDSHNDR